jgi:hypothetical protein
MSHIQKTTKLWTTHGPTITTIEVGFSSNISSTVLQSHHLHLQYLQQKHQCLYGRGISHIRIGEGKFTTSIV